MRIHEPPSPPRSRLDVAGGVAAGLCAVHCLLTPMIVAFGGLGLGATVVSERFEGVFTAISLTVGLASLGPAFLRVHRDPIPLVLFACGLAALAINRLLAAPPVIERWIVLLAAGLLILAHRRNHRACSRCGVCAGIERHRAGGR